MSALFNGITIYGSAGRGSLFNGMTVYGSTVQYIVPMFWWEDIRIKCVWHCQVACGQLCVDVMRECVCGESVWGWSVCVE